ncbi:hypothetical protein CEXT_669781 [Caerostris extrusa]|uniref:Uncharacterized protein n=1 Tax=Caerostris extrusa TaxID=172846 RepID=A0AAV4R7R9_CAEEX|nr:hypothetical protein CEXT_669781 [Caerostris extrusa]
MRVLQRAQKTENQEMKWRRRKEEERKRMMSSKNSEMGTCFHLATMTQSSEHHTRCPLYIVADICKTDPS